jgi:hypothetical protein
VYVCVCVCSGKNSKYTCLGACIHVDKCTDVHIYTHNSLHACDFMIRYDKTCEEAMQAYIHAYTAKQ